MLGRPETMQAMDGLRAGEKPAYRRFKPTFKASIE
jgi:hypothetical protein